MEKEQTNENSWEFHLTDKIAQLSKMTLEMHTEFWLSTLQTWFHGYQTPEEYKATIWGREVDLCISIAPLETPTEKLPIIEEKSEKGKNELLPPEQQAYVDELKKKIKALKKLLPPKVDEALEQRYLDYMNAERIKAIIQDCTKIWSNPDLPVEEKISQLIPYKIELYDLVRNVQLPDDLMRADTNISITMATIQFFAQSVEKNAKKNKIKTPKQVRQLVKFTNDIITRMDEGQNKLNGVERDMTKEESKAYDAYLDIIDICHTSPYHLRKLFFFLPAHQERFESLEVFCQLDALLGSFHEGFQFRRDLDICLQYLIDRSFEFGGMGGLEE